MGAFLLSTEVINIAILFSQVKVQSADQSETFLISGIPKEYEDLTESVQLEWFLQDIDSDETVQVHGDGIMEALWLTVGLLFGVCFSAIGLGCYQLKRISACEQAIRELKSKVNSKCPV